MTRKLVRANRAHRKGIDPLRAMAIHAVAEQSGLWIHTHGLHEHGLPELELRDVPTWMLRPGGRLLNAVADYLVSSGRRVRIGEVMQLDDFGLLTFERAQPREPVLGHYDHERWTIVTVAAALCPCDSCDARRQSVLAN